MFKQAIIIEFLSSLVLLYILNSQMNFVFILQEVVPLSVMKSEIVNRCWFESWFDSHYYHLLYGNRNEEEAENFIKRLTDFLKPKVGAPALDLGCGKGRHAIALHKNGFKVTGIDLSSKSIEEANRSNLHEISFFVHDMRLPFKENFFDHVFNLFTSFGYFDLNHENTEVLKAVHTGLKNNGTLVIDFLNATLVEQTIETHREGNLVVEGVKFNWKKRIENGYVIKDISFTDDNKPFQFTEKVQLLTLNDFRELLDPFFEIENIFGDYLLNKFDENQSPRLILIVRKK